MTPRIIHTYLTADRRTLLVLFDNGEHATFAVYPKPRTWMAQLWRNLQSWQWLPRIIRRVFA